MWFIIGLLGALSLGSTVWTIIQVLKPELFFAAETEANLKRERPKWYFYAGIAGLIAILIVWYFAFQLKIRSVWILAFLLTLGSAKPIGMVFFYEQFSEKASALVNKMKDSKKTYWTGVVMRAIMSIILWIATIYFYNLGL